MRIAEVNPQPDWALSIVAEDGRLDLLDVAPCLDDKAFEKFGSSQNIVESCGCNG
ncbi:hypothetical protein [Chlorobaculum tepidum]|uniref:hypothetical protein n=1 Tax=Chlorobaculum tepidum TaxID=1097 RepID=UPI0013E8B602|nr:hypothetical protein [Chlorobaculum tepidum]